ncbi:hypothetical protein FKW77_001538 [Venturia effusa]|uniref:Uncharacterized protein n=1 Tax=Venturia effusa TaxID=50376 RepID=A0A517KZ27_9PEZI|nr:hypothetical protein FKW77_001538 [Venturia effusa]
MPSSPPRRIHSRGSSLSSNSSLYSLNLDALIPPDEHDESSLELQQPATNAIDVVNSEDIDGPTDFTQNMEYWMSAKLPNVVEPTRLEGAPRKDMEEYIGSDDTPTTTKHVPAKHDSPLEKPLDDIPPESEISSPSTPLTVVERTSPPSRPGTRQATVEDYEDTPVRLRDTLEAPPTIPDAAPGPSQTELALEKALQTLRADLTWVRSQMEHQKHRHVREVKDTKAAHELQLEEAKREIEVLVKELEELGSEKTRVLEEAFGLQDNYDALSANTTKLEHALRETKAKAEQDTNRLKTEHAETIDRLKSEHAEAMDRLKSEHAETIEQLEFKRHQEISAIETKAEEAAVNALEARSRDEERARALQDENSNQIEALTKECALLRTRLAEFEAERRQEISSKAEASLSVTNAAEKHSHTETQLQSLQEHTSAQIKALTEARDLLQSSLDKMEADHRLELLVIEAEAEETVSNAVEQHTRKEDQSSAQIASLSKERDLLLTKFKDQKSKSAKSQSEFEAAIAAFESKVKVLENNKAVLAEELQKLRTKFSSAVRVADSKANSNLKENQKLSIDLKATNERLNETNEKLREANEKLQLAEEKSEAVNARFDKTVKDMLRKRDREWRTRVAELENEKKIMGKVLMKEWGEKECGLTEPKQGYRYKYV